MPRIHQGPLSVAEHEQRHMTSVVVVRAMADWSMNASSRSTLCCRELGNAFQV